MHELTLWTLAQLIAQRNLLVTVLALFFRLHPNPVEAAVSLQRGFAERPTLPPSAPHHMDAATTDALAAMTDETIQEILEKAIEFLRERRPPSSR